VTEPSRAVFLSYASEDASAAQRIAEALRSAGIEVWFDREELRGGDAWDRRIREQIHDCRLFIPVVSASTEARVEGYFRREWKLAVDRTHDLSERVAFLVPVAIDSTPEMRADVPDAFRHVQWTRLPGGETPQAFVDRVRRLLSPGQPDAPKNRQPADPTSVGVPAVGTNTSDPRRRVVLVASGAVVVLAALGYVVRERLVHPKPTAQAIASNSIAVLPLTNESGDASQQYFSDGLSEDLISALSELPGLKVIGRTSSFQFRDSKDDSKTIGAKLGVARLLEGSVRHAGDIVRVSAELIDTSDGSTQWSARYDRPYKDLFALQDDVTSAVAGALRAKLLPGEHAAAQNDRPPGGSVEAYNALLQGRFYTFRNTEADLRRAIESYTQATQLDPRYGLAWSELAQAWTTVGGGFLEGAPAQEAFAKARAAVDRALSLSPELAGAHLARGYLHLDADLDWHAAEAEYRRALELAPNDGYAKFSLGNLLATIGELHQAIELTRQALATDPLRADWYNWLALYLSGLNRLDEAERAVRRAIELQPGAAWFHQTLTTIEVQRGNAQAALAAAQQEPPGLWQDNAFALARQIAGDRGAAEAALRTLIEKHANGAAYQIAEIYAVRNDAKETFEWLERAWSNRDSGISFLLYDSFILRYKDDPRFAAYCRKVGLPVPGQHVGT